MEKLPLDERIALSNLRAERSKEMFEDARKSLEVEMFKTSVNRSYYAVLHAVRALLILKGLEPTTRDGALKLFAIDFVNTGLISKEMMKVLKELLSLRKDVDYGDIVDVEKDEAKEALNKAEKFLKEALHRREKLIKEIKS